MDLSTRTFRELIIELTHKEICAELRRRSGLDPVGSAELAEDEDPLLPEPA